MRHVEPNTKQFEKNRRQSASAILIHIGLLAASALVLWLLGRLVSIPAWFTIIVLGTTALTLVGDLINIIFCAWKLRR